MIQIRINHSKQFCSYLVGMASPIFFQWPFPWCRRPRRNSNFSHGSHRPTLVRFFILNFFFFGATESFGSVFFFSFREMRMRFSTTWVSESTQSSASSDVAEFWREMFSFPSSILRRFRTLQLVERVVLPPFAVELGSFFFRLRWFCWLPVNLARGLRWERDGRTSMVVNERVCLWMCVDVFLGCKFYGTSLAMFRWIMSQRRKANLGKKQRHNGDEEEK